MKLEQYIQSLDVWGKLHNGMVVYLRYAWFYDAKRDFTRYVMPFFNEKGELI